MKKILTLFLSLFFAFSMIGQTPFKTGIRLPNVAAINVTDSIPVIGEKGIIKNFITRNNLVNQNNKAKILNYYSTNIKGVSASDVANFINTSPTFNITETDITYVSINWRNIFTDYRSTYLYILKGVGKGQYGVDGAQITASSCYFVASSVTSLGNIQNAVSTQFVDLGTTTEITIEDAVNNIPTALGQSPFQDQEDGYVIINVNINTEDSQYLYLGEGGAYGAGSTLVTTSADFTLLDEDANVLAAAPTLQSVIEENPNAEINGPFYIASSGDGYIGIDPTQGGVVLSGRGQGIVLNGDSQGVTINGSPLEVNTGAEFNEETDFKALATFDSAAFFNLYAQFNGDAQFMGSTSIQGEGSSYSDFTFYGDAYTYSQASTIDADSSGYIIPNKVWIENAISTSSGGSSSTGLEQITEGGNIGYRLVGSDPTKFGTIGNGAIDFGIPYLKTNQGALGDASLNVGEDNIVDGYYGFGNGYNNNITKNYSWGVGSDNTVDGEFDYVFGINQTVDDGNYNIISGAGNNSKGHYGGSIGLSLTNNSVSTLVVGQGNTPYDDTILNEATAPHFIIGNGHASAGAPNRVNDGNKSDAFIVRHNGYVEAPSLTNAKVDAAPSYVLTPKSWVTSKIDEIDIPVLEGYREFGSQEAFMTVQLGDYTNTNGTKTVITNGLNTIEDYASTYIGRFSNTTIHGYYNIYNTTDDNQIMAMSNTYNEDVGWGVANSNISSKHHTISSDITDGTTYVADQSIVIEKTKNVINLNETVKASRSVTASDFRVKNLNTSPTSPTDFGTAGEIRYTADYIYLCVAANTWKRVAITTWSAK